MTKSSSPVDVMREANSYIAGHNHIRSIPQFNGTPDESIVIDNVNARIASIVGDDFQRGAILSTAVWLTIAAKYPTIAGHIMEHMSTNPQIDAIDDFAESVHIYTQELLEW